MEKWSKPQLTDLSFRYTAGGGLGGAIDGQLYQVVGQFIWGTSGPDITDPRFNPVP